MLWHVIGTCEYRKSSLEFRLSCSLAAALRWMNTHFSLQILTCLFSPLHSARLSASQGSTSSQNSPSLLPEVDEAPLAACHILHFSGVEDLRQEGTCCSKWSAIPAFIRGDLLPRERVAGRLEETGHYKGTSLLPSISLPSCDGKRK